MRKNNELVTLKSKFRLPILLGILFSGLILIQSGCDLPSVPGKLAEAIASLPKESEKWREFMEETRDELPKEIRGEFELAFQRAIAAAGAEFKCDTDFIRDRLIQDLERIRAKRRGEVVQLKNPHVCHTEPITDLIELDEEGNPIGPNWVKFVGYDLDGPDVQALIEYTNGELMDVTHIVLNDPDHYTLTVDFDEVSITPDVRRIIIQWSNEQKRMGISYKPTPTPGPIPSEEYVDCCNKDKGMHACPKGFAIAGVHAGRQEFLCRRVMPLGEEELIVDRDDAGTKRKGMHACPLGMYMRGLHVEKTLLLCSYDPRRGEPSEWLFEFEDTKTREYRMHVCPQEEGMITYLTGIHVHDNRFLCGVHYLRR